MGMSMEERTRTPQKDAAIAAECQRFAEYLAGVRKTVELPYANSLCWRIGDVQRELERVLGECDVTRE